MLPAFNNSLGLPTPRIILNAGFGSMHDWTGKGVFAEMNSIQLEFIDLSRSTRDPRFEVSLHQSFRTRLQKTKSFNIIDSMPTS